MKAYIREFRTAALATLALAVLLCGVYPLIVWLFSQLLFPQKAGGSLLIREGRIVGSELIGQRFTGADYFHSRPSAAGQGYDAANSGGSNLGPLSKKYIDTIRQRVDNYRQENGLTADAAVPADAVTASGSGLDPHISVKNALLQAPRIARARKMNLHDVLKKIETCADGRDLGVLGEPRIPVLMLNMSLNHTR